MNNIPFEPITRCMVWSDVTPTTSPKNRHHTADESHTLTLSKLVTKQMIRQTLIYNRPKDSKYIPQTDNTFSKELIKTVSALDRFIVSVNAM